METSPPIAAPGSDAPIDRRRARVLLVDDDRDLREIMAEWLATKGYDVAQASDGEEAYARLSTGLDPDVIVLDLRMSGMDGWTFLARLRGDPDHQHRRVLIASAEGSDNTPAGADGCVMKPFVPEHFGRELSRLTASDA